jgi:4-hydroxythreonine-4-phosphate dehydrogenase
VKPTILITTGDFNGVGPEVSMKAAASAAVQKICTPVLVGPMNVLEHAARDLKIRARLQKTRLPVFTTDGVQVLDVGDGIWADVRYGTVTKAGGRSAGVAIEHAVEACLNGSAQAMVTAPASKEALNIAGYQFPGQTEMVALLSRSPQVAMMLVSKSMRIGLVTIHVSLREASETVTREKIVEKTTIVHGDLKRRFRIESPKLAVLGLNPHAGEQGLMGSDEKKIILPAIEELRSGGIELEGPFPADGFFGNKTYVRFDGVMAMYHDQGLIPIKMNSFGEAVNFSAGLNIIRTSPDHGTAYDLAGKGKAQITSMVAAIKLAVQFARSSA